MQIKLLRNQHDVERCIKTLNKYKYIGFDTEFEGPKLHGQDMANVWKSSLVGASFACRKDLGFYLPVKHSDYALGVETLQRILSSIARGCRLIAHNAKVELSILQKENIDYRGYEGRLWDSMVLAWLSGAPRPYGLKPLMQKLMPDVEVKDYNEVVRNRKLSGLPAREIKRYAGLDAIGTLTVGLHYYEKIKQIRLAKWYQEYEVPTVCVLQDMEAAGIALSGHRLLKVADQCEAKLEELQREWNKIAPTKTLNEKDTESLNKYESIITKLDNGPDLFGETQDPLTKPQRRKYERLKWQLTQPIDIGSSTQLRRLFELGLWTTDGVPETDTGELSTGKECLAIQLRMLPEDSLGYKLAALKQEQQDYAKILTTYTRSLVKQADQYDDARIHGNFLQTGTATGRLASNSPNLQNFSARNTLSKEVLSALRPSMGNVLISADYSQIELRILAHLSGDEQLMEAYLSGADVHQRTADLVGCSRDIGKMLNFAIIYGMGPAKMARTIGCSVADAKGFIQRYKEGYKGVARFMDNMYAFTKRKGYTMTLAYRRRYLPDATVDIEQRPQDKGKHFAALRRAGNTPIQGSAADIMKVAMVRYWKRLKHEGLWPDTKIVSQIHDDLISDVPVRYVEQVKEIKKYEMENAWKLKVPLVVEPVVGHSFAELKG